LHLEFVFWATWQMREQTCNNCQTVEGLAKALHTPSSTADRSHEGLHPRATINCRSWPTPSCRNSLYAPSSALELTRDFITTENRHLTPWVQGRPLSLPRRPPRRLMMKQPGMSLDSFDGCIFFFLVARRSRPRVGRNRDRALHEKKIASGSTLGKCQVNYAKPLDMAHF